MLPPPSLDMRMPKTMQSRSAAVVSLTVVTSISNNVVGSVSSTTGIGGVRSMRPMPVCNCVSTMPATMFCTWPIVRPCSGAERRLQNGRGRCIECHRDRGCTVVEVHCDDLVAALDNDLDRIDDLGSSPLVARGQAKPGR